MKAKFIHIIFPIKILIQNKQFIDEIKIQAIVIY